LRDRPQRSKLCRQLIETMPKTTHSTPTTDPVVFEPEFIKGLTTIFEESIVFNTVLGLKIASITPERVVAHIAMKPELVGHYSFNRLAVMAAIGARHMDEAPLQRLHRFSKLGTIDLRIDYLRPGISERFELRAEVMRLGSRVASTRMEFLGADGKLLSTGSGAYIVS
jgi:acyl-coenzyme A thioesterase PaaI-like protein